MLLVACCAFALPHAALAAGGRPLASCIAGEKIVVTGTALSNGQGGRRAGATRSTPLAWSAEREVGALGGAVIRVAAVPNSSDPAAMKGALSEARKAGGTMLIALAVTGKESEIANGWITENLGPIRTFTLRLQGTLADVRTGRVLAFLELPPQPVAATSQESAIQEFVEESGYGVSQAILSGMMTACEQRPASYEVAERPMPSGNEPVSPAGTVAAQSKQAREKSGDDAVVPVPVSVVKPEHHYALIIGVSQYQHLYEPNPNGLVAFRPLKYADADANEFARFLKDESKSGAKWDVTLLTNEQATRNNVEEAIERIIDLASPTDVVLFFFSGHGAAGSGNSDIYLLTYDTNQKSVASGVHFNHLIKRMNQSAALQIVAFVDACRAGAAAGKGDSATSFDLMRSKAETEIGKMRMFLTAGQAFEPTWESDTLKHGVFTHYLLEGLTLAPQTSISGHSSPVAVTLDSIYSYVSPRVIEHTKNKNLFLSTQHPGLYGDAGMKNRPEAWPLGFRNVH